MATQRRENDDDKLGKYNDEYIMTINLHLIDNGWRLWGAGVDVMVRGERVCACVCERERERDGKSSFD